MYYIGFQILVDFSKTSSLSLPTIADSVASNGHKRSSSPIFMTPWWMSILIGLKWNSINWIRLK